MLAKANSLETYRQQGVLTASPGDLVVMLYDGCIKQVKLARMAIGDRNIEKANTALQKAQDIIMELINSLDMHFSIARDLLDLYQFVLAQLTHINATKDGSAIDGVLEVLTPLREAWAQAARQQTQGWEEVP